MKSVTFLKVWARLLLRNKNFVTLAIMLALSLFLAQVTPALAGGTDGDGDKGAPGNSPDPFG
ncbi:MAG: hypothetical protein DRJ55_03515 [Thermoprotei archaeon]|nr:MAG: hypothetical protein DRJ55_03515 [Thermoprotei archaeon]